jgi:N-acetylglucosamine-6-phosphate deacetylase
MIVLSGADLVLPDRILSPGTIVIDGDRIVDVRSDTLSGEHAYSHFAFHNHYIVPGFIDVHVHGVEGDDALDGGNAIALDQVRSLREVTPGRSARVLPARLESNFISPDYRGAQPLACLRSPAAMAAAPGSDDFTADDILREIERAAPDVGIVTIAPELDGGLDLVRWLIARGHQVSLGHSGASYDQALEAIALGATHATHLFNRMPPFHHRAPGLVGAILETEEVAAELICDGIHLHPAVIRTAVAAKRTSRVMAITDGTGASGLPAGARATLGGQPITVRDQAAYLDDGTLAGSATTMDRVFQRLVGPVGLSPVDAVTLCSTTPARELGLIGHGVLAIDAVADLVVLDAGLSVVQTYVAGALIYSRNPPE